MSTTVHERPGVYSSYDASSVISSGRGARVIGVAARAVRGTVNAPVTLTGYVAGVSAFGEDAPASPGMETILRLLFQNGATEVVAVRAADSGGPADYQAAFKVLTEQENVQVCVCDSAELTVQQALRDAVASASGCRHERIGVVGADSEAVDALVRHAAGLNSERMVLVGPDAAGQKGGAVPSVLCAAALAGAVASASDPAVPLNGTPLYGLEGLSAAYTDNDIDALVRGGVTPLESVSGVISPVRCVTTRTTTGGAGDATWRELTTILIVDNVIPSIRSALRRRFTRTKNTVRNRSAVRSQVIVELEKKLAAEIIDGYSDVSVTADDEDPTVCRVSFGFSVAHGMNQIYLTAHITV